MHFHQDLIPGKVFEAGRFDVDAVAAGHQFQEPVVAGCVRHCCLRSEVPRLVRVTLAPAITPPEVSVTVPRMGHKRFVPARCRSGNRETGKGKPEIRDVSAA